MSHVNSNLKHITTNGGFMGKTYVTSVQAKSISQVGGYVGKNYISSTQGRKLFGKK